MAWSLRATFGAAAVVLSVGLASTANAERAAITLDDGRQFRGKLLEETDEQIVIEIGGHPTRFRRTQIAELERRPSVEVEYHLRSAELPPDDLEGRQELVRWLMQHRAYELASRELERLKKHHPGHPEIERLSRILDQQRKLREQSEAPAQAGEPGEDSGPAAEQGEQDPPAGSAPASSRRETVDVTDAPRLTEQQMQRIRVYEVDLDEEPPVRVPRETMQKVFEKYAEEEAVPSTREAQEAFLRQPGRDRLGLLFNLQARAFYEEARVLNDPPALRQFSSRIHKQYVLNYCATNACHGGQSQGGLALVRERPNTGRTIYTNFYILNEYENEDGRMIDRDAPMQSLLLQYGMAREAAEQPHPEVARWRPEFQSRDNERLRGYAEALGMLYTPRPDYRIDFDPRRVGSASAGGNVEPAEGQRKPGANQTSETGDEPG
jgi:hypothetical protein